MPPSPLPSPLKAYPGSTTDTDILIAEGYPRKLKEDQVLLYDKGAPGLRAHLCNPQQLMTPAFLHGEKLTQVEYVDSAAISERRSHIERLVRQLKLNNILTEVLPSVQIPDADNYLVVAAAITRVRGGLTFSAPQRLSHAQSLLAK